MHIQTGLILIAIGIIFLLIAEILDRMDKGGKFGNV